MSENVSVKYNGTIIHTATVPETFSLQTENKYMADDLLIEPGVSSVLDDNSWKEISSVAQEGTGSDYWSIGDTKKIKIQGTIGTAQIDVELYVYIIGINHESVNGITFQGFKTALSNGTSVALTDSAVGTSAGYSGTKYFQMNHWGTSGSPYNTNYGGWKGCDARYDILGSTDAAPSGYGSPPTTSRVGYDASSSTATNPVSNTLMSCLPGDLRAVMKPLTIYTNNVGNGDKTSVAVTSSIDYLPLLGAFEIFEDPYLSDINPYEKNNQTMYSYYSSGNSVIKYNYSSVGNIVAWWLRSPLAGYYFITVSSRGNENIIGSRYSLGVAPIFRV